MFHTFSHQNNVQVEKDDRVADEKKEIVGILPILAVVLDAVAG